MYTYNSYNFNLPCTPNTLKISTKHPNGGFELRLIHLNFTTFFFGFSWLRAPLGQWSCMRRRVPMSAWLIHPFASLSEALQMGEDHGLHG